MPELTALEEQLGRLGADLEWPVTPNLAQGVRLRITPRRQWFESRWAMAAAIAIFAIAALVAYPPSRDAIANWFNLHVRIQQVPQLPTPTPLPSGPLGTRLGLGSETTLSAAAGAVSWHVLVPSNLGQPDEAYLQLPPTGPSLGEVTLVYAARPGIPTSGQTGVAVLITEARGSVNKDFFGKTLGPGTTLENVTIAGHQGYWFAGEPHAFVMIDSAGHERYETLRMATNTLVLDDNGTIVRIEGDLSKTQALQIATSLA